MHGTHNENTKSTKTKIKSTRVDANAGITQQEPLGAIPAAARGITKGSQVSQGTELKQVNSSGLTQKRAEGNQV